MKKKLSILFALVFRTVSGTQAQTAKKAEQSGLLYQITGKNLKQP